MVKKSALTFTLIVLFLVTMACKDTKAPSTYVPSSTSKLVERHHISELVLYGQELYFGAGHCLHRLDVTDQTLTDVMCDQGWVFEDLVMDKQRVYVRIYPPMTEEPSFLAAIDLSTQTMSWRIDDELRLIGTTWKAPLDATLYMDQIIAGQPQRGRSQARICGFEVNSGERAWCAGSKYYYRRDSFLLQDDLIWNVVTEGENVHQIGQLVAVSPQDGSVRQRIDVWPDAIFDELLYVDEQWIFGYYEGTQRTVFAIDRDQPEKVLWSRSLPEFADSPSQVLVFEDLFIGESSGTVFALDITNGQRVWQFDPKTLPTPVDCSSQVILFTLMTNWHLDITTSTLYALNAASGTGVWAHPLAKYAEPVVSDGIVYIANKDSIDALDIETGTLLWQVDIDSSYMDYIDFSEL